MADPAGGAPQTADWLHPPVESEGLSRYLATLRERIWLVVLVVVITTGLAIIYIATATKTYEAEADLFVDPIPPGDTTLSGLSLITSSSDPTRDVTTAAQFVTTNDVAERVADEVGLVGDPQQLLDNVAAEPVAQSNFVAITAKADSPADAAAIANAFAEETVADRTEQLHDQIDEQLPDLLRQQKQSPSSNSLDDRISALQQLRTSPDPTIRVETEATEPTAPVSPRPLFSIFGGLLAGLVLGAAAAFAAQGLDPRLRREEQLRRLYRLPILARIPVSYTHLTLPTNREV